MGGAFIAVADDATAASWNPGGLIQLERPEISAVGSFFHRTEDNHMGVHPEAEGEQSVSEARLNYLSLSYPFVLFSRNMIVSVNYQYLYDFAREWAFPLREESTKTIREYDFSFEQKGSLAAIGFAYCIQVVPRLSFGFTLNIWEDPFYGNGWKQTYRENGSAKVMGPCPDSPGDCVQYTYEFTGTKIDEYSFSGFNANVGALWKPTARLTIGGVFKTPFTASLEHKYSFNYSLIYPEFPDDNIDGGFSETEEAELSMPMSYGIGFAYRFMDTLTVSADVFRTEWDDFVLTDSEGSEISPISGLPRSESDIDATHQVRIGLEYLIIKADFAVPVRGGLFYDPAPAERHPDDFFGCSFGTGIAIGPVVFDAAYQFRFGKDAGSFLYRGWDFSQDVYEHTFYSSLIVLF